MTILYWMQAMAHSLAIIYCICLNKELSTVANYSPPSSPFPSPILLTHYLLCMPYKELSTVANYPLP